MSVHAVFIIDAADGTPVEADLDDDPPVAALLDVEDEWGPARDALRDKLQKAGVPRDQWPESLHWDWVDKSWRLSLSSQQAKYRCFGLRRGGLWQGAMVTLKDVHVAHLPPDAGQPVVYLDYLESAPWNWDVEAVGQKRQFKGVGPVLFAAAIAQSRAVKCDGRIGLLALPQAEAFYRSRDMLEVQQQGNEGMRYFELTAAAAAKRY